MVRDIGKRHGESIGRQKTYMTGEYAEKAWLISAFDWVAMQRHLNMCHLSRNYTEIGVYALM